MRDIEVHIRGFFEGDWEEGVEAEFEPVEDSHKIIITLPPATG